MARYDVDSRRRNAAGKLIGSHNGDKCRWYNPMAHSHRTHSDGPPPTPANIRRKRTRQMLATTSRRQAQPPAPKHTVDVAIFTLNGMGDYITHAHDTGTALQALRNRDARSAGGVSIHGWIDGVQYSGAVPLAYLRQLLS